MNKLKRLKNDTKGFTLMEIIIVIVIIGILAALLVPNMISWVGKSKKAAFKDEANNIKQAITAELVDQYAAGNNVTDQNGITWKNVTDKFESGITTSNISFEAEKGKLTKFEYKDTQYSITFNFTDGEWNTVTDLPKSSK